MAERRNAGRGEIGRSGGSRKRQSRAHRARVVADVEGGIIGLNDALRRYDLSLEEFVAWEREVGSELADRRPEARLRELARFVRTKPRRRPN